MAWQPISPTPPESRLERARLTLTDGRTLEWREVQLGADSIRGVADARAVALPSATVNRLLTFPGTVFVRRRDLDWR